MSDLSFPRASFRAALLAAPLALLQIASPAAGEPTPKPAPKPSPTPVAKPFPSGDCSGQGFSATKRAFLGVEATPITPELRRHFGAPEGAGVLVSRVIAGGPAARAGVEVGDILTRCGDAGVRDPRDLGGAVRGRKGGETVMIEVFRGGKAREIGVKLDEKESCSFDIGEVIDAEDLEELGKLGNLDPETMRHLDALGDIDIDLGGLDLDGLVRNAVSMAVMGMEQALASGELQRELEGLKDGRMEELQQRMEEISRQLEQLEVKIEAEAGPYADKARAEIDRARQQARRELEKRQAEIEKEAEKGADKAHREAEKAQRDAEAKAKGGGSGGGNGSEIH